MLPSLIPQFGPISDMRVLASGSIFAMPYAATLLADFGAQVIHIERPNYGDTMRNLAPVIRRDGKHIGAAWAQDSRNKLSLSLELNLKKHPESKEIFYGLIKQSDVFMENMVWLEKLGIYDDELLKVNPKLVIVHVSGYGHEQFGGEPEVCNRPSYDLIGQAFSGWLALQGHENEQPPVAKPYLNDYVAAMSAVFGTLLAFIHARKTGEGQVVDVAQFEAMGMFMSGAFAAYGTDSYISPRLGNDNPAFQPYGIFKSSDGRDVAIAAFGPSVYGRFIKAIGFDAEYYSFKECTSGIEAVASPRGRELAEKIDEWCLSHTAEEIEDIMSKARVACTRVNTPKDCYENKHFIERDDWITYKDETLGSDVTAFGISPKLSATPGRVWRGAPSLGEDTDRILKELLGYDDAKISDLRDKGII